MSKEMPSTYKQLLNTCNKLERHFKEPQDIEFTVEKGRFYLLQTRSAKMNTAGMIRTSVSMVKEKMISKERAILRLHPEDLDQILHRTIDTEAVKRFSP
ncbi:Pyruvate,phosphate dikinase [Candidatus Nitrosotalea sp. TS]|uniref:PEP/pyruvate-binding domain-containing protein n=1 Tax=Candidatus Nitrosotalea sp. TS TaxID=2341020 RepID=UPI001EC6C213|nr:PEP/pyruvate-binding domain-containing protein [Candidatus Nitrosotalea sp. TS]NHI02489.1 Pyruvate,phosphate dikinase [Candidatus Nitrosotalea sp. TS]